MKMFECAGGGEGRVGGESAWELNIYTKRLQDQGNKDLEEGDERTKGNYIIGREFSGL